MALIKHPNIPGSQIAGGFPVPHLVSWNTAASLAFRIDNPDPQFLENADHGLANFRVAKLDHASSKKCYRQRMDRRCRVLPEHVFHPFPEGLDPEGRHGSETR